MRLHAAPVHRASWLIIGHAVIAHSNGCIGVDCEAEEALSPALLQVGRKKAASKFHSQVVHPRPHRKQAHGTNQTRPRVSYLAAGRASLNRDAFLEVARLRSKEEMAHFIDHVVTSLNGVVVNRRGLDRFAASTLANRFAFNGMLFELRRVGRRANGFAKFAPPIRGHLLWKMIRSDPWLCDLILQWDPRQYTCGLKASDDNLDPQLLSCATGNECSIEHANSFRTLFQIGSLPCCPTSPFCSAPACAAQTPSLISKAPQRCTKRSPEDNVAYMKRQDAWPAYHGWGGSFEIDTLKFMDALACHGPNCSANTFDLAFDLGANSGFYTEKLTVRSFAANYIMVDANPENEQILQSRWGNQTWKHDWFTKQMRQKTDALIPKFEIMGHALSNNDNGTIDMCQTEVAFKDRGLECQVPVASIDELVPNRLSPSFQKIFRLAKSAFIKIDTEGMDELVIRGMKGLLEEKRGRYDDGSPRYLVNFLQFEYAPVLMEAAKKREDFVEYDIKTVTEFLESIGFESFLIGPRFLPLSHGSWNDEFKTFIEDPSNNAGTRLNYPDFDDRVCGWCAKQSSASFTADIFAIRTSHPRAAELKLALGVCKESTDFDIKSPKYDMNRAEGF